MSHTHNHYFLSAGHCDESGRGLVDVSCALSDTLSLKSVADEFRALREHQRETESDQLIKFVEPLLTTPYADEAVRYFIDGVSRSPRPLPAAVDSSSSGGGGGNAEFFYALERRLGQLSDGSVKMIFKVSCVCSW